MQWFGESWGAPICDPDTHTAVPVGINCIHCGELIEMSDAGVIMPFFDIDADEAKTISYHRNCFLRTVVGSVKHQTGDCSCRSGHDDLDGKTLRQDADEAVDYFYRTNRIRQDALCNCNQLGDSGGVCHRHGRIDA